MTDLPADDQLRALVRQALAEARISQAEIARQLGLSTKHLSHMLTGRATLTLTWAEGILGLCGMNLQISVQPDQARSAA
ncbi:helix-turn-helix domain-containing protein [Streptomyces sp. ISBFB 2968]|uniref:helix-turn-helix domain-containing protein n=1 Tax=Streptomyces sp. ISBFB 2968 TaxID=2903527 RepID=UPI002FDBFFF8